MVYTVKSSSDFEKKLASAGDRLVVVDFYATWCGPCRDMDPKIRELSKQYGDRAMILKVNVDKCDELAQYYNVTCMPTFVFIKNKKKVSGFTGADDDKLERRMARMVK